MANNHTNCPWWAISRFPSVLLCFPSLVTVSVCLLACRCVPLFYHSPIQLPAASTCQLPTAESSVPDSSWTLVVKPWLFIQSSPDYCLIYCGRRFGKMHLYPEVLLMCYYQPCVLFFCAFPHLVTSADTDSPLQLITTLLHLTSLPEPRTLPVFTQPFGLSTSPPQGYVTGIRKYSFRHLDNLDFIIMSRTLLRHWCELFPIRRKLFLPKNIQPAMTLLF